MKSLQTIALVDITAQGHHLTFVRLFAKTLLELNYQVVVFIPEFVKVDSWIKEKCESHYSCFYAFDYQDVNKNHSYWGRFNYAADVLAKWKNVAYHLKKVEHKLQTKVDFVFFAWLDSFLANYLLPQIVNIIFPYKWSGLYFHPRHLRIGFERLKTKPSPSDIDIILRSSHCKNIVILDEGIAEKAEKRLQKAVIVFPDIADDTTPAIEYELAMEIRAKSKNRIVVGIIGLEKRKGVMTLVRLAKRASTDDFYFVLAGRIHYETYTLEQAQEIENFILSKPENCFFHLEPIEEGEKYNAVFNVFDIPFVVYHNFTSSSNVLTKSAVFNKSVLATNLHCIGETVNKYQLGVTVDEDNEVQILDALKILQQKIINKEQLPSSYNVYKHQQSTTILLEKFKTLLKPHNQSQLTYDI